MNKALKTIIALTCALVAFAVLMFISRNFNPGATEIDAARKDLSIQVEQEINNAKADALGELSYVKKIYKLPLDADMGPQTDQTKYVEIDDGDTKSIQELISRAKDSVLLDGQDLIFTGGSKVKYYMDDTLLVICWQEQLDGKLTSLCEVKVQDASQFRRKITKDIYETNEKDTTLHLAYQANAVAAMSADYYKFRDYGISVYKNVLKRFTTTSFSPGTFSYNYIDSCFVKGNGDLAFFHKGGVTDIEQMQNFISDEEVMFSLAFGPVLIENGEICEDLFNYPIGEPEKHASRAAIAQYDTLHYLYMNVSWNNGTDRPHGDDYKEFAQHLLEKGVKCAYNLDGGQSAEMVFNNEIYNAIDYDAERAVGDCIYFATAK